MTRHLAAKTSDIPPGGNKVVSIGGRDIVIFHVNGEFFALLNRCPHAGAEMCRGDVVGEVSSERPGEYHFDGSRRFVVCPWHGWEFDLRTGQSWCDPNSTRARQFRVTVEPGETLVKGPYVAETFPVSLEEDYLVIDLTAPATT
ncbi:MAG: Rieske (2Fe-2S) protein [Xanthobacteraceae bacterium]